MIRLLTAEGALNIAMPNSAADASIVAGCTEAIGSIAPVASTAITAASGRPPRQRSHGPAQTAGAARVAAPSTVHTAITRPVPAPLTRIQAITKVM